MTKKTENTIDTTSLRSAMERWRISSRMLSNEIGMPEATFKNKLNPNLPQYNFTPMEFIQVQVAIIAMMNDLKSTVKKMGRQFKSVSNTPK